MFQIGRPCTILPTRVRVSVLPKPWPTAVMQHQDPPAATAMTHCHMAFWTQLSGTDEPGTRPWGEKKEREREKKNKAYADVDEVLFVLSAPSVCLCLTSGTV